MMYYTKRWFVRKFFKLLRKRPDTMPMVDYWKHSISAQARVTKNKDGVIVMDIEGEKETFPGYPRGHSLFGSLSPLKHQIKNQVFNDSWAKLEQGVPNAEIIRDIKDVFRNKLTEFWEQVKYDAIPPNKMVPAVRELWRAMTVLEKDSTLVRPLKEIFCFILQEDDAYRFRVQWLFGIFKPRWWLDPVRLFDFALSELEVAEVIGDMKERQRLLRRILMLMLEDNRIRSLFIKLCKELDWKKIVLSKADRYHFRGKYFKVDLDKFEY